MVISLICNIQISLSKYITIILRHSFYASNIFFFIYLFVCCFSFQNINQFLIFHFVFHSITSINYTYIQFNRQHWPHAAKLQQFASIKLKKKNRKNRYFMKRYFRSLIFNQAKNFPELVFFTAVTQFDQPYFAEGSWSSAQQNSTRA